MEFGLLGPLEVRVGGHTVVVGSPKLRILLAALLLRAGRPVQVGELVDAIWGAAPPSNPRSTLQVYVTRLRAMLDGADAGCGALIVTGTDGYVVDVAAGQVDLLRFQHRLEEADRAAELASPEDEAAALVRALAEWRGEPLADVPSELLQREVAPRLREQRLRAVERRIDVDLRRGRHSEVVGELVTLTAQQPLRERLWALLMTALDGSDRRSDALSAYQTVRRHLAEELGVDPGEELRHLHAAILAGPRASTVDHRADLPPVPRQLPPDVRGFTGRVEQLARLDALLPGSDSATTVVISAIAGTAGVGKTALAAHWARRVADRFPDGQLWVNLRGYDAGQHITSGQVLTAFLRSLGMPGERIPLDLDEQAGLYRSFMDGRRMLVVLDNAHSPEQVRPLLPGAPGCLVVVTSRNQLTGLVATDGVRLLTLDVLSTAEAYELLARRLGAQRVAAEPRAAAEIVAACARLPLALAIVAARAAAQPEFPLYAVARELRDARGGLDAFDGGEAATDIRTVFSWSYRILSDGAARLFRLLGRHPGPDISPSAAASLAGVPPDRVRPLLAELTRTHLVTEQAPGRYGFHDLLRAYATELAGAEDSEAERQAATHRVLDHYLHTGYAAARLLNPTRESITLNESAPGTATAELADHDQAMEWFAIEHPVLLAAVEHAAATGWDTHTWQLAWAFTHFLYRQGHWHDMVAVERAAVAAARQLADPTALSRGHRSLADAYAELGRYADAHAHLQEALDLANRAGDQARQAHTHYSLGYLCERQGRHTEALDHGRQALALFRAADHRAGQANALNAIGWCHTLLGDYEQALTHCQEALALQQKLGDQEGQAHTWDSLGYAHHHRGQHEQAVTAYWHAIDLLRNLGHRHREATALTRLGDTHHAAGDPEAAHDVWRQALATFDELDHPDAAGVRAKLAPPGPG